jgi:hypothetical protein
MSIRHNSTWKIVSENNISYAIGYHDKFPVVSIPIIGNKINKNKLIKEHNLDPKTRFVLSNKDIFIGW